MRPLAGLLQFTVLFSSISQTLADEIIALRSGITHADADDAEQQRTITELGALNPAADSSNTATPRWLLRHDYRVLTLTDWDGSAAASNGHVHQLSLAMSLQHEGWQATLQPVVATSSNALRHTEQLHADDWRLQGSLAFSWHHNDSKWQVGVQLDDRLGRYRAYPTLY